MTDCWLVNLRIEQFENLKIGRFENSETCTPVRRV
jgi:hypothetical protein